MTLLLGVLIFVSIVVEGTLATLPLTLICLVCLTVIKRDTSVFPLAFIAGIIVDIFRMQTVGISSIYYIGFLFLILLYQKKYEIYSAPFVLLAVFFGAFMYLYLLGYQEQFVQAIASALLAMILFSGMRFLRDAREKTHKERFLSV